MHFKFVGIGGSLKSPSSSSYAMQIALRQLQQRGHIVKGLTASEISLPLYGAHQKLEDYPQNVHHLLNEVRKAHGLIFSSPIYHGSLSGAMKNVMDYFEYLSDDDPPYLSGKVAALISTSGGGASVSAINVMDQICRILHAWVCPTTLVIPMSSEKFDSQGNLKDEQIHRRLLHLTDELEFAVTQFNK
jgi:FMN reductase